MKATVTITRILVGLLFIFSGLVKAIDPLGLSYKMQEFFELWHITQFNSYTLTFSVLMIAFEIIAGFALLLGWQMKLFSWLLLLLIIFFTFLTGYAYLSGKFKNCGCFGDCIPISPLASFIKDIALLALIVFLFVFKNRIRPAFNNRISIPLMLLVTLFSFGLQWYALKHLPPADCLPFKKGNNISEKMKIPANAIPDSIVMTFVYEKAGQRVEFTADKFPDDFNDSLYTFKDRYDKVVRKGKNNEPLIKGFNLSGVTNIDSTEIILQMTYALLLFEEKPAGNSGKWEEDFKKITSIAEQKHIPIFIVTRSIDEYMAKRKTHLPVFKCDFTAIRTAARANPTLYLLEKGNVNDKWSFADFDKAIKKVTQLQAFPEPVVPVPAQDSADRQPATSH